MSIWFKDFWASLDYHIYVVRRKIRDFYRYIRQPIYLFWYWCQRQLASQKRYYNERRMLERQIRQMIADTAHFANTTVLNYVVEYATRYDRDQRSLPFQVLIQALVVWRPGLQNDEKLQSK